jgi:hypothetical protein
VRKVVAEIGSPRCVRVDGLQLLKSAQGLSCDLTHPSPFGMEQMAENLAAEIGDRMVRA